MVIKQPLILINPSKKIYYVKWNLNILGSGRAIFKSVLELYFREREKINEPVFKILRWKLAFTFICASNCRNFTFRVVTAKLIVHAHKTRFKLHKSYI